MPDTQCFQDWSRADSSSCFNALRSLVTLFFTDRAMMVAVESGAEKVGQWVCEKRNLHDDYLKLFGETPPNISGVAIMTDTDNTGESAQAAYSDLVLR